MITCIHLHVQSLISPSLPELASSFLVLLFGRFIKSSIGCWLPGTCWLGRFMDGFSLTHSLLAQTLRQSLLQSQRPTFCSLDIYWLPGHLLAAWTPAGLIGLLLIQEKRLRNHGSLSSGELRTLPRSVSLEFVLLCSHTVGMVLVCIHAR